MLRLARGATKSMLQCYSTTPSGLRTMFKMSVLDVRLCYRNNLKLINTSRNMEIGNNSRTSSDIKKNEKRSSDCASCLLWLITKSPLSQILDQNPSRDRATTPPFRFFMFDCGKALCYSTFSYCSTCLKGAKLSD